MNSLRVKKGDIIRQLLNEPALPFAMASAADSQPLTGAGLEILLNDQPSQNHS